MSQLSDRPGTAARCACHRTEVMAVLRPDLQAIVVKDRRHGTVHGAVLSLTQIVRSLDPTGTTALLVGTK